MSVLARAGRAVAGAAIALLTVLGGLGILYLLRQARAPAIGPLVAGALPLQQLAGDAAQPLASVVVAYTVAGAAAGLALSSLARMRAEAAVLVAAGLCWIVNLLGGAASDAVASSLPFGPQLLPQLAHAGLWASAACVLGGAALARRLATADRETELEVRAPVPSAPTQLRASLTRR